MPTDAKSKRPDSTEPESNSRSETPKRKRSSRKSQKSQNTQAKANTVDVAELQAQLTQKEEVVAALTARLEQAAEQLDRVRRTGGHRGGQSTGTGLPTELVQEQRQITEELQRAVQQWEDMQAGAALGRLEMQVTELRDFISGRFDEITDLGGIPVRTDSVFGETPSTTAPEQEPSDAPAASDDPLSAYELLKADLMAGDTSSNSPVANSAPRGLADSVEPATETAAETTLAPEAVSLPDAEPAHEPIPEANAPTPIDIAGASLKELQAAVETRDAYISYLIRKLRVAEASTRIAGDWASLENVPDELRARLEELEKRLQDAHRIAEVENSLERARLAREAARLEVLEQQMQKKMRQLGIDDDPEVDSQAPAGEPPAKAKKGRSWLKRLGVGRDDDDSE